jgi:hypothetical protein
VPSLVSAQLIPQSPKVDRLRTKVTLKSPSSPYPPMAHPTRVGSGPAFADSANFAVAQLGLSMAKVPTGAAMLRLCLSSRVHTS